MRRGKKLMGLLAVFLVLVTITCIVKIINQEEEETTADDVTYTILTIEQDMVDSISWIYEGETLTFNRTEDSWSYAEDSAFPLDESYIDTMLSQVNGIQASKIIENVEDAGEYGLTEPVCSIYVDAGGDYNILIGDSTSIDGLRYVSIGDDNVYLVEETLLDSFSYGLYDILENDTIPDMTDVKSVSITSETGTLLLEYVEVEVTADTSGDTTADTSESTEAVGTEYVWICNGDESQTLDTELTEEFISNITDLTFNECANYNADEETLTAYNFGKSTVVTATVVYTEDDTEQTFTIKLAPYIEGICFSNIEGSSMVYSVDSEVAEILANTGYEDLKVQEATVAEE